MIGLCLGELLLGYFVLSPVHHAGRGSLSSKPWNKAVDFSNTNLLRENKDKRSLFFYAVSRGDFLFTVRKIIIITVNRKEFSMKYKEWLDVWFANHIKPSSKRKMAKKS